MKKIQIWQVNSIYIFLTMFLMFGSIGVALLGIGGALLGTQILLIAVPTIILGYIFKGNTSLKYFFRLNRVSLKTVLVTITIGILMYPISVALTGMWSVLLPEIPKSLNNSEIFLGVPFWMQLVGIGILPGIFEELMFRGFFIRGTENKGRKFSIIFVAFLFALFHFNPYNIAGPFLIGIMSGILILRTNSIIPSMILHVTNNVIAVGLIQLATIAKGSEVSAIILGQTKFGIAGYIIMGIICLICISIIAFLLINKSVEANISIIEESQNTENKKYKILNNLSYSLLILPVGILTGIIVMLYVAPQLLA